MAQRPRRLKGTHGAYKRKDGKWVLSVELGIIGGVRKRRKYIFPTLRKLQRAEGVLARTGAAPPAQAPTVAQYLADTLARKTSLRPRTRRSYERTAALHITPYLGPLRVSQLTPDAIDRWLATLTKKGVGSRTIQLARAVLRALLKPALRYGWLASNPAGLAEAPKHERKAIQPLTPEQARTLLDVLGGEWLDPIVRVALSTGLRPGEVLALQWSDVNLTLGSLTVRQTLQRVYAVSDDTERKTRLQVAPTKTTASRRTISLPPMALEALKAQRELADMLQTEWVFPSANGTPLEPRNVSRAWYRIRVDAGLPHLRLHDLRHSYATFALLLGVPVRTVADALGHAETRTTLDTYGHVLPQQRAAIAAQMGDFLGKLGEPGSQ